MVFSALNVGSEPKGVQNRLMGPVGFEPTTFTRNDHYIVSTGFFTAPEPLHPSSGPQTHLFCLLEPVVIPG